MSGTKLSKPGSVYMQHIMHRCKCFTLFIHLTHPIAHEKGTTHTVYIDEEHEAHRGPSNFPWVTEVESGHWLLVLYSISLCCYVLKTRKRNQLSQARGLRVYSAGREGYKT